MEKKELKDMTKKELQVMATELGVVLNSKAKIEDYVKAIEDAEAKKVINGDKMEFGSDSENIDDILSQATNPNQGTETGNTGEQSGKSDKKDAQPNSEAGGKPEGTTGGKGGRKPKELPPQLEGDIVDLSEVPITPVETQYLVPSPKNFFRPLSEKKYNELKMSIKVNGMLSPIIARPMPDGINLEMISGHNRKAIADEIGIKVVPVKIVDVTDDKAKEIMIDLNVAQRQELSPIELAKAYEEKTRLLGNRQGRRSDLTKEELEGASRDIVAQEYGKSGMTISRYLRLNKVVPEMQNLIEEGKIAVKTGFELGLIDEDTQTALLSMYNADLKKISTGKVKKLKKAIKEKEKAQTAEQKGQPVYLTTKEIKEIIEATGDEGEKELKFSITVPADYDPDTVEFIEGNLLEDSGFLLDLLRDYVQGNLVQKKK